jgi:hypothetical protein
MTRVILPYIAHCCCCIPLKPGTIFLAFVLLLRAIIGSWNAVWNYSPIFPQLDGPEIYVYLFLDLFIGVFAVGGVTAISKENTRLLRILSRILLALSFLSLATALVNIGLVRAQRDSYISWCTSLVSQDPFVGNSTSGNSTSTQSAGADCWGFWNAALIGSVLATAFNWIINTYFALCLDSYRRHLEAEGLRHRDLPMSDVYPRPPSPPDVAVPPPYHASPKLAPHPLRPQADMPPAYPHGEVYKGTEEGKWV